jgi:hypothetical protein
MELQQRKAYTPPQLVTYGSVEEITLKPAQPNGLPPGKVSDRAEDAHYARSKS